jgi:hypothetical protein
LLDNASRSVLHPDWSEGSGIEPHFRTWDEANADQRPIAAGEQAVAEVIADTPCTSVGLANWIFYEYPVWTALRNEGWHGRIDDVGVRDSSKSLGDPPVAPCALIRQVDATYVTADRDWVSLRFGPMALSILPSMVSDATPDQPGFHSDVLGVRVLPGSGWTLGNEAPAANGQARIYVFSNAARTVRLQADGILETTIGLKPGVSMFELPGVPGEASPPTTVSVRPV